MVVEGGVMRAVTSDGGGAVVAVDVTGTVVGGVGAVNIDFRSVPDPYEEGVVVPPPPPPLRSSKEGEGDGVRECECECAELQCGSKNFFRPCVDDIRPIVP